MIKKRHWFIAGALIAALSLAHGSYTYYQEKKNIRFTGFLKAALVGNFLDPVTKSSLGTANFEMNRYFIRSFHAEVLSMAYAEFDSGSVLKRKNFEIRPVLGSPGLFKVDLFEANEMNAQIKLEALKTRMNSIYSAKPIVFPHEDHLNKVLKNFTIPLAITSVQFSILSLFNTPDRSQLRIAVLDTVFMALFLATLCYVVSRVARFR